MHDIILKEQHCRSTRSLLVNRELIKYGKSLLFFTIIVEQRSFISFCQQEHLPAERSCCAFGIWTSFRTTSAGEIASEQAEAETRCREGEIRCEAEEKVRQIFQAKTSTCNDPMRYRYVPEVLNWLVHKIWVIP